MQELLGRRLGNYRLQQLLGRGGFADVYLGEHIHLHTQVAIKVLHIRVVVESLDNFLHEAQVVAQLDHPHIVRVFEFDVVEGTPYLAMTYAPFGSMRQRFTRGVPHDPAQVLPYVQQVASALQYAHDQKLIHRDVKPENILLGPREEVLLSDFGLVLLAQSSSSMRTEEMAGTIPYMAPEQIQGRPRLASDQYALGITVYEWLCGEKPFTGHFVEIASQHVLAQPPSLCQRVPGLAPAIEAVIFKALAKTPEERYPSVLAFADALTAAVQNAEKVLPTNLLTSNVPDRLASTLTSPPSQSNEAEQIKDGTILREPQRTPLPPTQEALFALSEEAISTAPGLRGQQADALPFPPGPLYSSLEEAISTAPGLQARRTNPLARTQLAPTLPATSTPLPAVTRKIRDGHAEEREWQRRLLMRVAIIVGILLLCTGLVLALFQTSLPDAIFASTSANVTIVPDSQAVQTIYTVSAVTGSLDSTQPQIQARKLNATSSVASTAVPASGQGHSDATYAYGTVQGCYVGTTNTGDTETIPAGTVVTAISQAPPDSAGHTRTIKILSSVSVLRYMDGRAGTCSNFVQARYMYPGSAGNIREYADTGGGTSEAFTGDVGDVQFINGIGNDFSGGQDASDYTYIQQSDIDHAMNNLASQPDPNAQSLISKQLRANEHLVSAPDCQTKTSTDHALSDHAASVRATKTSTCSAEAYDYTRALQLANKHLWAQASAELGPDYGPQGTTKLTLQNTASAQHGTIQLTFQVQGTLVYQISAAKKRSWQQALQGKSKNTAVAWLRGQPGIRRVTIVLHGWNQQSLPASASTIAIIIASPD